MSGPRVLSLDRAGYHTALAALHRLGATDLGRVVGLNGEVLREARTAFPDGPAMMRPPAIGRYVLHLRRALAHQCRQGFARHVMILDAEQYKTLWIALWLHERTGAARGCAPEKGLVGDEARAFIDTVRDLGRHAAWT